MLADRVFHERLDEQAWYGGVLDVGGDGQLDVQFFAEADFLYRQIMVEERKFVGQGDFMAAFGVEREPQQIAQMLDHLARQLRFRLHLRRNGIEGVEQEVGIELQAQRIEPGFRIIALEPLHLQFGGHIAVMRLIGPPAAHDQAIHEQRPQEHALQRPVEQWRVDEPRPRVDLQQRVGEGA